MSLISAGSISLDSTFKARVADPDPGRIILGSWIQIRFRVKNSRALEARMHEGSNLSHEWSVDQWWQICIILMGSRIRIKVNSRIGILISIQVNPDRL